MKGFRRLPVVHDAKRDAEIVYQLMKRLNLSIVEYIDSLRGLIILGRSKGLLHFLQNTGKNMQSTVSIDIGGINFNVSILSSKIVNNFHSFTIALKNSGDSIIPFIGDQKLFFSYHTADKQDNIIQWDNNRYELPCDLDPGDEVHFDIKLSLNLEKDYSIYFDLVREGEFWWSKLTGRVCPQYFLWA